ncbi:MAG: family acetyltransferase [Frankiales bacterium]|nr:family acetyltransferase [Frankiales bacterium]
MHPPVEHVRAWVGGWPPQLPVHVVTDPLEGQPAWDGAARGVTGVVDPDGRCVVRMPADVAARLPARLDDVPALLAALPGASLRWVPRHKNLDADALSQRASLSSASGPDAAAQPDSPA